MLTTMTRTLAAFVIGLAAAIATSPALAQEGGVAMRAISSFTHNLEILDMGDTVVTAGMLRGTTTVVESDGDLFVEDEILTTDCVVFSAQGAGGVVVESHCVATDLEGNQLFLTALREKGDAVTGDGVWMISGGTGRFAAAVGGECIYTTQYLPGNRVAVVSECGIGVPG